MKKILCFIIAVSLVLSSLSVAYAKPVSSHDNKSKKQTVQQAKGYSKVETKLQSKGKSKVEDTVKDTVKNTAKNTVKNTVKSNKGKAYGKKQSFKLEGSPVIKYGKYKIPIRPITKGMAASYTFDKTTGILTITKDTATIIINFKDKKVTVNGVEDTNSGIFTAKNDKKAKQVLRYIADRLGVRLTFSKDKVTTETPEEDGDTDTNAAPTIAGVISAVYSVSGSAITLNVSGAGAVNDKVDVTKISLTDSSLNQTYQLMDSTGVVNSDSTITINLSSADLLALAGFGSTTISLNVAAGSLIYDAEGNLSPAFTTALTVPVTVTQ